MSKVKHGLWIAALIVALAAPTSWAEETSASPSWFELLVAQVVAAIAGPDDLPPAVFIPAGDENELGELIPVNG